MFEPRYGRQKPKSTRVKTIFQKILDVVLELIRIVLGIVFIFSGFVKAIDPLGSTYKLQDYLTSFGDSFIQFHFIAFPVAIILSTFELLLGLAFFFRIEARTNFHFIVFVYAGDATVDVVHCHK
ncbi:MAG: hypothetical protein QM751_08260 [Paludibacteraceae bacterium]